jgi:hypothetical protein
MQPNITDSISLITVLINNPSNDQATLERLARNYHHVKQVLAKTQDTTYDEIMTRAAEYLQQHAPQLLR